MQPTEPERRFLSILGGYLVSLPFDLKVFQEAVADEIGGAKAAVADAAFDGPGAGDDFARGPSVRDLLFCEIVRGIHTGL